MTDHRTADEALADALWWFRGFAAAHKGERRIRANEMANSLRAVRLWLGNLSDGGTRLLGTHERAFAVVLTEYEFEVLCDVIPREVSTDPDVLIAQTMRTKVITQFRAEQQAFANAMDKELPF